MQRRAAAASAVVFVLIAAGAYAFLGVTTKPDIQTGVAARATVNESVTLDGKTYSVTELTGTAGGQATLKWFNDSVRFTETIDNASNVSYQTDIPETDWDDTGITYRVTIPNTSNVSSATFTELQTTNRTTFTENGTRYVLVDQDGDGTREAVPFDQYYGEPRQFTVTTGDSLTYQNNSTTVVTIEPDNLTLAWRYPSNVTARAGAGENVTLPTGTYLTYFQDTNAASEGPEVVVFTQDFAGYQQSLDRIAAWTERMKGLWGIVALGLVTGLGLIAVAYLPSRY